MGNQTGNVLDFSLPSSTNIDNNKPQSSPQNAKNIATNDFLDNIISDMDEKINDTSNNQYKLKKKICAYNTNDFNNLFKQISDSIDVEYDIDTNPKDSSIASVITCSKTSNNRVHVTGAKNELELNEQLYVEQVANIKAIFKYKKQLGKGGTCRVILVENIKKKNNNKIEKYALKELSKLDKYNEALFAKEIQVIKLLKNNINVVDYYGSYQTKDHFYLATSYCSGGTFLDRILRMKSFSEQTAARYIYRILLAIQYMHSRNIVHRDLKLNNMVFDSMKEDAILKIIDFGDSDVIGDDNYYKELVGTLYYLSPECKLKRKGWEIKKSDMWAIGVICYILLSGKLPFSGDTQQETFKIIENGKFEWPKDTELSASCKSFINGLLRKSTKKRFSAKDALSHEWIIDYENKANDVNILDKIKLFLKNFNYNNKLHKILVNACLEEINENEKKIIIKAFHNIDTERKGNISESDLCKYLILNSNINKQYGKNNAQQHAKHIFDVIENQTNIGPQITKSKSIPIQEFVKNISDKQSNFQKYIDSDSDSQELEMKNDNYDITVSAFKEIMKKSQKKYPVDNIVHDLDPKGTGYISFQSISKFSKTIQTISYDGLDENDD